MSLYLTILALLLTIASLNLAILFLFIYLFRHGIKNGNCNFLPYNSGNTIRNSEFMYYNSDFCLRDINKDINIYW